MWKVYLSRWINHWLFAGKSDQMLSSRMHVECHPCERVIDVIFFWHTRHCRRSYLWEVQHEAAQKRHQAAQGETQPTQTVPDGMASLSQTGGET